MLVLRGLSTYLYGKECVTRDNSLSMFMYAIGSSSLIHFFVIPDDGYNCDMVMMLLSVELCQSYIIGLINFVHAVLTLSTILKF